MKEYVLPHTTEAQKSEIKNAIIKTDYSNNEKVFTYLVADILVNSDNRADYINMLCGEDVSFDDATVWFEAQPISPRKGTSGNTEGNTCLDLSAGNIKGRDGTLGGIEYNPEGKGSWTCFVEAKVFSDISAKVSYDPLRNQMARVIENLLCFQANGKFPQKLFFTLLTPRLFKCNPRSRLYGYKMREYSCNYHLIAKDINMMNVDKRNEKSWKYPDDLHDRLACLRINWFTYEDIFEKEFGITGLDLTKFITSGDWEEKYNEIRTRLKDIAGRL